MSKNKVVALFTILLSFILFVALKPGDNPVMLFRIASIVVAIIFAGVILYTRVLWKVPPFNKLHNKIDIGGKWRGSMVMEDGSSYAIDASIVQYLDDIKLKIKTNDILNDSLVCHMSADNQGVKLYAVYKSKPSARVDYKEQIYYGTFIINCDEDYLEGIFFASNDVSGRIELYRK